MLLLHGYVWFSKLNSIHPKDIRLGLYLSQKAFAVMGNTPLEELLVEEEFNLVWLTLHD